MEQELDGILKFVAPEQRVLWEKARAECLERQTRINSGTLSLEEINKLIQLDIALLDQGLEVLRETIRAKEQNLKELNALLEGTRA